MIPPKAASPFRGGTPEAFYFICADPHTLTGKRVGTIISQFLQLQGGHNAHQRFDTFVAFVEHVGLSREAREVHTEYFGLHGKILWVPTKVIEDALAEKLYHEKEHKRDQGHVSTVPTEVLTPRTCPIAIGSRSHLGYHVDLYFERSGIMRDWTIPALHGLLDLKEVGKAKKSEPTYLPVPMRGAAKEKLWAGNFDELVRRATLERQKLSPEELGDRLKVPHE